MGPPCLIKMIEVFKQQFNENMPVEEKFNRTSELLQIIALKTMYDKGFFNNIAFTGGTALRILFNLRRFSEDLDFSLISQKGYDFHKINAALIQGFKLHGLNVEGKPKTERNVHSTFLKFKGLLKELGLSPLREKNISIKIEIDTNPPKGGNVKYSLVNKVYMFSVTHFDLSSMYATKLHACFYRKFTKGRDFYDFIWYLAKKIKPNWTLLNNAIKQTHGKNPGIDENNFKVFLLDNVRKIDFDLAKKDVERFLEDKSELKLFDLDLIEKNINAVY